MTESSRFVRGRRGFPAGSRQVQIPAVFFTDMLPEIVDPVELVVLLHAFSLLSRKKGAERWFSEVELASEGPLRRSLLTLGEQPRNALADALSQACERGVLLAAESGPGERIFALNAPGYAAVLSRVGLTLKAEEPDELPPAQAANIFLLYEQNVGTLSPLLAEQLREAQEEFPWPWIVAAFREAVSRNRRNWRYIERILARWRAEGPDLEAIGRTAAGERHGHAGRYWRLVEH
jgi:DnaD/phage-associated family protein